MDELLATERTFDPLHLHDCPPISDGGVCVVLAAGDRAREWAERPAWISGIDHRVDSHNFGARDLTEAPSIVKAERNAGLHVGDIDIAELHAPFTHQERIVAEALRLPEDTVINPSGGPLAANPMMAAGLIRIGEVATRIMDGSANRGVAHATSGHLLQQNLVCVLDGES